MRLDVLPEQQRAELAVGRLVHGLGLQAHPVLLRAQLGRAALLVPQVEQAPGRRAHHQQVAVKVFAVQVHVFAAPAFDVQVEATWRKEKPS